MRRWMSAIPIVFALLVMSPRPAVAAPPAWLVEQNRTRLEHTRTGMAILATWAGVNLIGGVAASLATTGTWQAFHQMNAGWNLVNLAVAGFGLWSTMGQDPNALGLAESLDAAFSLERTLWLNVGLDVAYVLLGRGAWDQGVRTSSASLEGFGQSIVLQGAFLLAFDVTLSVVTRFDNAALLPKLASIGEGGVGVAWGGRF